MTHELRGGPSARATDLLLIVGFLAILVYPSTALLEGPEARKAKEQAENRTLTARPPLSQLIESPSAFVTGFKSYFEDQFGGRGRLVTLNSKVRYNAFQVSTKPTVLIGKHGSMFFAGEAVVPRHDFGHETARHRRVLPITERRLDRVRDLIVSRQKWAESMGAKFVFVVAPDKSTTYSENLPDGLNVLDGPTFTDRLLDHLRAKSTVEIVDLRPALAAAHQEGRQVFYLRDTHWNYEGAFVGYNETTKWLKDRFPSIHLLGPDDVVMKPKPHLGDLAKMLHLDESLNEPSRQVLVKTPQARKIDFPYDATPVKTWGQPPFSFETSNDRLPNALVYHDSFLNWMIPYLAENFHRSIFIRDQSVKTSTVKGYKPDVVVFECIERTLYFLGYITDDLLPTIEPEMVAEQDALMHSRPLR